MSMYVEQHVEDSIKDNSYSVYEQTWLVTQKQGVNYDPKHLLIFRTA